MSDEPSFGNARRQVRERELTETIRVASVDAIPDGYVVVRVASGAVFAKAQVLSRQFLQPIFVEREGEDTDNRRSFWVHPDVMRELSIWIDRRVFRPGDS